MPKLSDEYGIEVDSRYATCVKEAAYSLIIFLLAAIGSVGSIYGLTYSRSPEQYGEVLGLPAYLFWGVIVVDLSFLVALLAGQRFIFRDLSLEPVDPAEAVDDGTVGSQPPDHQTVRARAQQ